MSQLLSHAKGGGKAVEQVARRIEEISTLPHVAIRVMQIANDPDSDAGNLTEAMESDTALSARVLRCVNSSAFAVRQKITNLRQAIAYMGTKQIRNIAVTASVSELFQTDEAIGTYRRSELWKHLVSVGICARMLAVKQELPNHEDMFLAGLLHDIGIIFEDQYVHESFCKVLDTLREDRSLAASERETLGYDHTTLGETMAEIWGFPEAVKAAIRYHHMSINYRGKQNNIVRCVEVANGICTQKGLSSVGLPLVKCTRSVLATLSFTTADVPALTSQLDEELEANAALFCV